MISMACKKGQYFSFDAIVAVVIFIIALTILSNYWFGVNEVIRSQDDGMYRDALRLSDSFMTSGVPIDWNTNVANAHQIGFTTGYEGNALNDTKLKAFHTYLYFAGTTLDETRYQASRGLFRTQYDYYFNVTYDDPSTGTQTTLYEFGKNPALYGSNNTVRVDRLGSLNTTSSGGAIRMVGMHMMLWTNQSKT